MCMVSRRKRHISSNEMGLREEDTCDVLLRLVGIGHHGPFYFIMLTMFRLASTLELRSADVSAPREPE